MGSPETHRLPGARWLGAALLLLLLGCAALAARASCAGPAAESVPAVPAPADEEPDARDRVIRLVRADGSPAAGIEGYGVQVDPERPLEQLTLRPAAPGVGAAGSAPPSAADAGGLLWIEPSSILAVRLTPDALAALPLGGGETVALPEVAAVELELKAPQGFGEQPAELVVRSADLRAGMVEGRRAPAGGFAREYEVRGWSLAEPRVFAWRVLSLSRGAAVEIQLPHGRYTIEDAGGTSGWWLRTKTFEVGSDRKVLLHEYQPPMAELSCVVPGTGRRRVPRDVSLRFERSSYDVSWNGGWPLRWRAEGDTVRVALENKEGDGPLGGHSDPDDPYWLQVTWDDGAQSTTDRVSRAELDGPLELGDVPVRE